VLTSKRPQINDVQYLRIPSRILKGVLNEEIVDDVVAKVAMSGVGR
jgi:ribose 5-phosphate isomerase RpiB